MKPYPSRRSTARSQPYAIAPSGNGRALDHAAADLVQRRSARRQPGADRADGRRREAADVPAAGEDAASRKSRSAFPSASQTEFDFIAQLIDETAFPTTSTVQVLTQAREAADRAHVRGARRRASARSSTSTTRLRRRSAASCSASIAKASRRSPSRARTLDQATAPRSARHRVDPRVFAGKFHAARSSISREEICDAVMDVWQPTPQRKMIINLPATVEIATPNVYADQIEWMCRNLAHRDSHHRCRCTRTTIAACGVAAAELGAAGRRRPRRGQPLRQRRAHRQRLTSSRSAMNLYTQGIDPGIDFSDINDVIRTVEHCNQLPVASAPSVRRRARVHRVLGLAPGRDQEGPRRARAPNSSAATSSGTFPAIRRTS